MKKLVTHIQTFLNSLSTDIGIDLGTAIFWYM